MSSSENIAEIKVVRTRGKLIKWFADREYGFIQTDDYEGKVIAHVSAFPNGESQSNLNEILIFDLELNEVGAQARNIQYANREKTIHSIKPTKVMLPETKRNYAGLIIMAIIAFLILQYMPPDALIAAKNQPASVASPSVKAQ